MLWLLKQSNHQPGHHRKPFPSYLDHKSKFCSPSPSSKMPALSSLIPRCKCIWASMMPRFSPCRQQRGAATLPTPSLSPTPRAPSSHAASGTTPALTWLSHPQPGPWDGANAAVGWWDSHAGKNGTILLSTGVGEKIFPLSPASKTPKILHPTVFYNDPHPLGLL